MVTWMTILPMVVVGFVAWHWILWKAVVMALDRNCTQGMVMSAKMVRDAARMDPGNAPVYERLARAFDYAAKQKS